MDEQNSVVNGGNNAETALDKNGSGGESYESGGDGGKNAGNNAVSETGGTVESSIEETGGGVESPVAETDGGGNAEKIRLVYIGPSLTFEKLRTAQVLYGTEAEIADFMRPIIEKYPEAAHLLVTPEELPGAMAKVSNGNSVLSKYYADMLAKSRDIRKG